MLLSTVCASSGTVNLLAAIMPLPSAVNSQAARCEAKARVRLLELRAVACAAPALREAAGVYVQVEADLNPEATHPAGGEDERDIADHHIPRHGPLVGIQHAERKHGQRVMADDTMENASSTRTRRCTCVHRLLGCVTTPRDSSTFVTCSKR